MKLTVQMNEDGSGQVHEDIVFGEKLVNAAKRIEGGPTLAELTGEQRVKERMAKMGKGVSLVSRKTAQRPDGSLQLQVVYAFEDISELRLAPIPFGAGWEDVCLEFHLEAATTLSAMYDLRIQLADFDRRRRIAAEQKPLGETEVQQIRRLLPIFKDMLEGFELQLRLELFDRSQWASVTQGHPTTGNVNPLSDGGGRVTFFHLTDKDLRASEDGLLMLVPWRQVGREFDLYHWGWPPGPQIMPYINQIQEGGAFRFNWRAIQKPHGREYY